MLSCLLSAKERWNCLFYHPESICSVLVKMDHTYWKHGFLFVITIIIILFFDAPQLLKVIQQFP